MRGPGGSLVVDDSPEVREPGQGQQDADDPVDLPGLKERLFQPRIHVGGKGFSTAERYTSTPSSELLTWPRR